MIPFPDLLAEPFSGTPYYDFLDSFLLGLQLETFFDHAKGCINSLVYTLDDYVYFNRNISSPNAQWYDPVLNISQLLAGNFTNSWVECYQFGDNWYVDLEKRWNAFGNNFGNYTIAFVFNQMGNALAFDSIIKDI